MKFSEWCSELNAFGGEYTSENVRTVLPEGMTVEDWLAFKDEPLDLLMQHYHSVLVEELVPGISSALSLEYNEYDVDGFFAGVTFTEIQRRIVR